MTEDDKRPTGGTSSPYDVRIWAIRRYKGAKKTTYTVRWTVAGETFPATFATYKLAESFRSTLLTAAREGEKFDLKSGLPASMARSTNSPTWYEHACSYVDMKWPHASPKSRKGIADALATVTPAMFSTTRGKPDAKLLRKALYTWAFNASARKADPTAEVSRAAKWVAGNTLRMHELAEPDVVRHALDTLATKLDGTAAAATTIARKRAVFYGTLRYAVEIKRLDSNPIDQIQWKTPKNSDSIDRRVVVNHGQARRLLAAVRVEDPALEAFYATMYYAGLRPAEALHLSKDNLRLPASGWGELLLTGSVQHVGEAWGDSGRSKEDQGLKHRAVNETRIVPACPQLVQRLRHHIDMFGTGANDRLFVVRQGKDRRPIAGKYGGTIGNVTYAKIWRNARKRVLTAAQVASPLARRPYDLRHACVSLQLNAGVPATQVAEWAGHSVHVLMKVYAKCVYGQEKAARIRIEAALLATDEDSDDQAA
jgi:integrase